MRCEHVRERAVEVFLEGETELPAGLRAHVHGCTACAAEVERLRLAARAARALPALTVAPPSHLKAGVFAELGLTAESSAEAMPSVLPERSPEPHLGSRSRACCCAGSPSSPPSRSCAWAPR